GYRNKFTAITMKKEGVVSGVADLILLKSNSQHSALCIEMKYGKNTQSDKQKEFQQVAEANGNKYVICRSFDEFRIEIESYLNA
ncbi:MAG: VRR-NUC domain-containing protein, partial [Burkholderiales bacterium]